jgi:uncharacterized protein (DUF302 family)
MASEEVRAVAVRRHIIDTELPFNDVLDGIFTGISRPDINALFKKLAAAATYEELAALVDEAQGSSGLMRFLQLDLDAALAKDPQAQHMAGRRLVRIIAGNPVTMGKMTRHVAAAGSYAPITLLVEELANGGTRVSYDSVASAIAMYQDAAASEVAAGLDGEVLSLLRRVTGVPAAA